MRQGPPIPPAVIWLGGTGLLPFVGGTALAWIGGGQTVATASFAVLTYGAVILSFLGGIVWGVGAAQMHRLDREGSAELFALSVIPPLVGWSALFLHGTHGFTLLSLAFLGQLALDKRMRDMNLVPHWWLGLRLGLTTGVILCLVLTAVAAGRVAVAM
ncbi:DUF3429 domain-containing protein [Roseospira navarrensis]|uniref:DUF3429 family protein n=1 Tax=Roseospira navarrensis TaxID=140058 RepID=A0A7X1ZEV3_9PROT|nr:DUF3429 domain-containing protein [Roseospira navarrensis]MQX37289.1 DUF3429 family protein [Roseospira navarrensis]